MLVLIRIRAKDVCLKETHSSYVLIAAPYAYKIKKPVNFGFLDLASAKSGVNDQVASLFDSIDGIPEESVRKVARFF
jgi:hypothetical protein